MQHDLYTQPPLSIREHSIMRTAALKHMRSRSCAQHTFSSWSGPCNWPSPCVVQRGGAPEFSEEMLGWVLSRFSVGSQNMNIFQKVDKNNFQKNWRKRCRRRTEKMQKKKKAGSQWVLGWVLSGFSVGPQRVLSEYSGYSWVLRLFIFEYSGGSQVGISLRNTFLT